MRNLDITLWICYADSTAERISAYGAEIKGEHNNTGFEPC